ncbi:MAG: hypothetical protein RLZZ628_3518 [Bacteroidota bacterium]|jgi:hypothetical protein
MATQQTLLPFYWFLFLVFFKIGDSIAQNGIKIGIQNDASEYPTLLCNYFKQHKAIFDSCGLYFDVKLQDDSLNSNVTRLYCNFLLGTGRDSFACVVKNSRTNKSIIQKYDYNITTDQSNESLLVNWKDNFLNLLFQIDTTLIRKVTDFKRLEPLLTNKDALLTHDNLLKNNYLCDLLDSTDIASVKYFAEKRGTVWKNLFANSYKILIVPFDSRFTFKPLRYLTNIRTIQLKEGWNSGLLKENEISYLKASGVSITIAGGNEQDKVEIRQKLVAQGINVSN